ncbi:MAG TPA: M14 family metallopeptidase [Usitatibacter sp.]|nr:M14 family metallopeptidase [Usitatibacter sp.]
MFRNKYVDYGELMQQLQAWAREQPHLVRLGTIGKSAEGRDIPLLTIGREPDEGRPAAWVDGNMHATELCGSSVALAIAEDVIGLHQGGPGPRPWPLEGGTATRGAIPPHVREILKEVTFYIVPRISPDGAEAVLKSGRYVRSSPVDQRRHKGHAYWEAHDFDGDGTIGFMRLQDDDGELVELEGYPNVMVPRMPDDPPPYYRLYPEGRIANFDGRRIPDPYFLSDNQYDFNRNFPYSWAPEHEQEGAGDFPGSAPETRAILEFTIAHPNIFAWLNLHTFGGVLIRPLGDKPDHKMDQEDLAVFRQVEAWMKEFSGYPTVSGFHEFLYTPETPLKGDMTDYAYHQRGCIGYVVELWDLFRQIGVEPKKPFVDVYSRLDRKDFVALAKWDRAQNKGRVFREWRKVRHPQLGDVEVGGLDLRVGISNPPYEKLDEVCAQQSAAFLRVAALLPRVAVEVVKQDVLGPNLTRIELRVVNRGYLGTYGLSSAKKLPFAEPLRATFECSGGLQVGSPLEKVVELGHLDGWGRGLYNGVSIFFPWTRGNVHERFFTIVTEGRGTLRLRVGSVRVGYRSIEVDVR